MSGSAVYVSGGAGGGEWCGRTQSVEAVDIEAGMAAFEARVAALNSQIEAVTADQRPSTSDPSV